MLNDSETYRQKAQALLPKQIFDYIDGGAGDESTIRNNLSAFERYPLKKCTAVKSADAETVDAILDGLEVPIGIAPMAFHQVCNPLYSELDTALAAANANIPMIVPIMSTVPLEMVTEKSGAALYLQMHLFGDVQINVDLIRRAEKSGYQGIVFSIDVPFIAKRPRDIENQFEIPFKSANLIDYTFCEEPIHGTSSFFRPQASWIDLSKLISMTKLPVYLKGVMNKVDATQAKSIGSQGIIVSNHGGRQADDVMGAVDALPDIVAHANGLDVWFDSGVRSGRDIFIALALGAKRVLLGRPILWALSVDGQAGIEAIIKSITSEFVDCMQVADCKCINDIRTNCLRILESSDSMNDKHKRFKKPECFLKA